MLISPELVSFDAPTHGGGTHRISCAQWGKAGSKPTLMCVHGLTRTGRDFDYIASAMAADFHVLAPDMAGRGKSAWLADEGGYNNVAYMADILFIAQTMGIETLHWLGTSMGGIIGMMMANSAPGLIRSMVINDLGCLLPAAGLARIRDISRMPTRFDTRADAEAAYRLRTAAFGITSDEHWKHLYAHGLERDGEGWRFTYDPKIFSGFYQNPDAPIADMDLWALWEKVRAVPVMLLRGKDSDLLLADTAQAMKANHPHLTLVEFSGVGHAPPLLEPKQITPIHEWMGATIKRG